MAASRHFNATAPSATAGALSPTEPKSKERDSLCDHRDTQNQIAPFTGEPAITTTTTITTTIAACRNVFSAKLMLTVAAIWESLVILRPPATLTEVTAPINATDPPDIAGAPCPMAKKSPEPGYEELNKTAPFTEMAVLLEARRVLWRAPWNTCRFATPTATLMATNAPLKSPPVRRGR